MQITLGKDSWFNLVKRIGSRCDLWIGEISNVTIHASTMLAASQPEWYRLLTLRTLDENVIRELFPLIIQFLPEFAGGAHFFRVVQKMSRVILKALNTARVDTPV